MKRFLVLTIALLLTSSYAYADYYNYWTWNTGYINSYGPDGWVGADGIDRIIFYTDDFSDTCTAYIYQVTTDGNPNLHPDNPDATGPIANRTFTLESSFSLAQTNYGHDHEFHVGTDGFYLGAAYYGIEKYAFDGTYLGTIAPPAPPDWCQSLAYDSANDDWYTGSGDDWGGGADRRIYRFDPDNSGLGWQLAFNYTSEPDSSHHDGLEKTNGNLLIADFAGQIVEYTPGGIKVAVHNHDPFPSELEGMGSGALGHYWGGSHDGTIFEFGGGSLPPPEPIPEPSTMVLLGVGLLGLIALGRRKLKRFRK